jgi:integrase
MPKAALTDRFCAKAQSPASPQTDYFDTSVPGLALRVSASGRKAWTYMFTLSRQRKRLGLGTYPATGLALARSRALAARSDLEAGRDPRALTVGPLTLRTVCEEWFAREGSALRTGSHRHATIARLVYPYLGDRPVNDIRRSEIVRLLDRVADDCGASMADHLLAYLRRAMNWHAARSDDYHSPIVRGMARTKPSEHARERTLTDDELRAVWAAALADSAGVFGNFVRFILLTAARRNEAAAMTWAELGGLSPGVGPWTLPASRNKTKSDLVRPLSPEARASMPERGESGSYVFSTDGGRTPISGFSKFKARFDRTSGVADWTLHDLRRTARSLMSRAGVAPDHAERCLGHVIAGVRGVYDRHRYEAEMARAYAALAAQIDRIINPSDNVVPLRADANG